MEEDPSNHRGRLVDGSVVVTRWRWRESNSRLEAVTEGIYILIRFAQEFARAQ